jgi:hypothetical protein
VTGQWFVLAGCLLAACSSRQTLPAGLAPEYEQPPLPSWDSGANPPRTEPPVLAEPPAPTLPAGSVPAPGTGVDGGPGPLSRDGAVR